MNLRQFGGWLPDSGGIFHFKWVFIAAPMVIVVGLAFIPFLLRLPRATAIRLIVAGICYVGGSFGMEMVAGVIVSNAEIGPVYLISMCIEETLEIVGAVLALRAVMLHRDGLRDGPVAEAPDVALARPTRG
ncbi:hypothetical protein [Devosia sp.]|uniref:hypothetical protein n=1 Tax=Devosia sp. TaxID=1871048 RepID=UPI003A927995